MLAVSSPPQLGCGKDEMMQQSEYVMMNGCGVEDGEEEGFCDIGSTGGNLLDSIDFDDLFLVGINDEEDYVLPDLEMDPHDNYEILAEFSAEEESQLMNNSSLSMINQVQDKSTNENHTASDFGSSDSISTQILYQEAGDDDDDVVRKKDVNPTIPTTTHDSDHHTESDQKGRKSSSKSSSRYAAPHGKRKVKVDWTPELHKRFVQAVEQLGVDKAVPSRILELMGIDCLTRHNIASHLQKYRSHRKHLLAREAEATSWTQKRRLYCTPPPMAAAGGKRDMNTWHAPTIGFPPMPPPFRPLHVWGHPPAANHPLMHVWPKHLRPSPTLPLPPTWPPAAAPLTPPADSSFWHSQHLRVPSSLTPGPGTPCFPPNLMPRYPVAPVPGIPSPTSTMYKIEPGIGVPTALAGQALPQPPVDFHPSKESIDAAIGDVLSKPWLPLPLGLKPPSVDGVLVQLQRQGVPKIPPSTAAG